jgi:hypothetical protein
MNSIAFRKFEHRVKLGLGGSLKSVIFELGQDVGIRTTEKTKLYFINAVHFKDSIILAPADVELNLTT